MQVAQMSLRLCDDDRKLLSDANNLHIVSLPIVAVT